MSLAWPWSFLLLLPWAVAAWRMLRRGRRSGVKFAPVFRLPTKTAGWRARVANVAPFIFRVGAALLVVAAARPRKALARGRRSVDAIAIVMTVDVSGSMSALDFTPISVLRAGDERKFRTRLDVVKETFTKFIEARPDDLIGLVTFGGYASSRVPLTADHEALLHVLKGVQVPSLSHDANWRVIDADETRTAVGDGLATALARLKNAEPKTKIVVLLSDGASNTGAVEPDQAAAAAAKLGIRVYTIGVWTPQSQAEFDESQLKSIAAKTGGRYFSARDTNGLDAALTEIDALEKTTLDNPVYQRYTEYFPPFLLAGTFLVFAAVSLQMAASRRLA